MSTRRSGKVTLIVGPMMAGKTEELLRLDRRARLAGRRCVLIKHADDVRELGGGGETNRGETNRGDDASSSSCITTHALRRSDDAALSFPTAASIGAHFASTVDDRDLPHQVSIDEAQFFDGLTSVVCALAARGVDVVMTGLNAYADQTMWPEIVRLLPYCDRVRWLTAVCSCGAQRAPMTISTASRFERVVAVGGAERYRAVCRDCLMAARASDVN